MTAKAVRTLAKTTMKIEVSQKSQKPQKSSRSIKRVNKVKRFATKQNGTKSLPSGLSHQRQQQQPAEMPAPLHLSGQQSAAPGLSIDKIQY